jgi:hypothetical protein
MVFWWTGRGFLALLTVIGVFGAFGAIVSFSTGGQGMDRWPWLWGVGWLLAAAVNWYAGCRLNKRPLDPRKGHTTGRFRYPARHRFCSLPMETWSLPALALGLFLLVAGLRPA